MRQSFNASQLNQRFKRSIEGLVIGLISICLTAGILSGCGHLFYPNPRVALRLPTATGLNAYGIRGTQLFQQQKWLAFIGGYRQVLGVAQ